MSQPFFAFQFYKHSDTPLFLQLAVQLRKAIAQGTFLQGKDQLLSLREMKKISGCSLETVKKAYDHLVEEGWLVSSHGKGYFLTSRFQREPMPQEQTPTLSFIDSTPKPPAELIRRLKQSFFGSFDYLGESREHDKARRIKAKKTFINHCKRRGVAAGHDRLHFFNRSSSGFAFLVQYLMQPGDVLYTEEYSYQPLLEMAKNRGVITRHIPMDEEGITMDLLQQEHEKQKGQWLLLQPHYNFPTGLSYTRKRKHELMAWAERANVRIIEDDHHGDLWFQRPSRTLYRMAEEEGGYDVPVFYIHSFSKTLARDLQLGLLALPATLSEEEIEQMNLLIRQASLEPPFLVIEAISQLLQDPWTYETYLPERRAFFAKQWQILHHAMRQSLPAHARFFPIHGGLNVWISWGPAVYNASLKEEKLTKMLYVEGIEITPGHEFRLVDQETEEQTLRYPSIRFPLSPWGTREMLYTLTRIGAALSRI